MRLWDLWSPCAIIRITHFVTSHIGRRSKKKDLITKRIMIERDLDDDHN